ncbi:hypothetical protein SAMN04488498_1085 [Mesorhizobium albiziae]|uniref:Membrane protein involved in the export of O-antigen and teichoic acid n=1 Tax=Neomesorhizobium albiziae TaxID=335020 RepID=A0A1I4AF11_9HYPH|nr:hypothetical protein [Mesorhizobium albiziae]SFK54531.1 hypothetical protein SAMN04488498_1085 [Mesorhizobium albiziae]
MLSVKLRSSLLSHAALFGVSLLGVQGTIYAYQLLAAWSLNESDFAKVRLVESFSTIGALLVSAGIPSVALVGMAAADNPSSLRRTHVAAIVLQLFTALCISVICVMADQFGHFPQEVQGTGLWIASLSSLMAFRFLFVSASQATQKFKLLASSAAIACFASFALALALSMMKTPPLTTWFFSRLFLEFLLCAILCITDFRAIRVMFASMLNVSRDVVALAVAAMPVGASLVVRSIVDNGAVIWLAYRSAPSIVVAELGFVITLSMIALVPSAIIQGAVLPRLSKAAATHDQSMKFRWAMMGSIVLSTFSGSLFVFLIILAHRFVGWGHFLNPPIVVAGFLICFAKAAASAIGISMLVDGRGKLIITLNSAVLLIGLLIVLMYEALFGDKWSTGVMLLVVAVVELIAATVYWLSNRRDFCRP